MFNKDVKVPLQEAELVGTSSSNSVLVWFNSMGLLAMELLAVEARICLWLIVPVLLLFSAATSRLGALGFLALVCAWLRFFLVQVAVGAYTIPQFGVCAIGVLTHHCLEAGN